MTIRAGTNDIVDVGDVFEILRIEREVRGPITQKVLPRTTSKVGELTVTNVRDKDATDNYAGSRWSGS